jgi:ATP-dependent protease HslVU (ClpYQ) peptidase subunit
MTCIVGISDGINVYIGGDRGASDGTAIVSLDSPKVYKRGEWIFGYAGSMGIGQMMQCIVMPDIKKDEDVFTVLRMDVVQAFKSILDDHGITIDENIDTDFLIGARGRLFEFNPSDWSVAEIKETAIGSGGNFALGSLHTSSIYKIPIVDRIEHALYSAITYSTTCQGPIDILKA